MNTELERAVERELAEARVEHESVRDDLAQAEEKARVIIERAKEEKRRVLAISVQKEKDAKARVHRAEKALKVLRGEPIVKMPSGKDRHQATLGEDKIQHVLEAARHLAAESKDQKFTINAAKKWARERGYKVTYENAKDAIQELRNRELVRAAGTGKRGTNTVQMFKLMEYVEGSTNGSSNEQVEEVARY